MLSGHVGPGHELADGIGKMTRGQLAECFGQPSMGIDTGDLAGGRIEESGFGAGWLMIWAFPVCDSEDLVSFLPFVAGFGTQDRLFRWH